MYGDACRDVGTIADASACSCDIPCSVETVSGCTPIWSHHVIHTRAAGLLRAASVASRIASSMPVGSGCLAYRPATDGARRSTWDLTSASYDGCTTTTNRCTADLYRSNK